MWLNQGTGKKSFVFSVLKKIALVLSRPAGSNVRLSQCCIIGVKTILTDAINKVVMNVCPDKRAFGTSYIIDFKTNLNLHDFFL